MEVTFQCPYCNKPYKAPDHLIGRRIRCRNCGEAITVSRSGEEADLTSMMAPDQVYGNMVDPLDLAESLSPLSHRTNTPPRYLMSGYVDQYAPWVVAVVGAIAVYTMAHRAVDSTGWIGYSRAFLSLALFCGVVWPISLFGLKHGMEKCNLGLPPRHVLRAFACFIAPYAFGYYIWAKTSSVGSMIFAMVVGLVLAMGMVVVFFRLYIRDMAVSLTYSAVAFILSAAMVSGAVFGANVTLVNVLNFYKVSNAPASSPLAPRMPWHIIVPPPPTTRPFKPGIMETGKASRLNSDSPKVKSIETPELAPFDEIVHPEVGSDFAALIFRNTPEEDVIQLMQISRRSILAETRFKHEAGLKERYILSPRGDLLARVVNWPKLSAQIWSFPDSKILRNVDLTVQQGSPELLGFISTDYFLALWRNSGSATATLAPVNARTGEVVADLAKSISLEETTAPVMTISPDGRKLAVATRSDGPVLQIFDIVKTGKDPATTLKITALDPQWAISPTGLAFSPDATKVAIFFEHNDNALLLCWDINKGEQILEQVYSSSPAPYSDPQRFKGGSLRWIGANDLLLYGQTLISGSSQSSLSFYQNYLANRARIASHHVMDPFNFELTFENSDGRKNLGFVKMVDPNEPPEEPSDPKPE